MSAHKSSELRPRKKVSRRRLLHLISGAAIVGACAAMTLGALAAGPGSALHSVPVPTTAVPAGEYIGVCPEPAKLIEAAVTGVDPEFSPVSETARSVITAMVLSGPAQGMAAASLFELGASEPQTVLSAPDGDPAGESGTAADAAAARVQAAVAAEWEVEAGTVLRAEPLPTQTPPAGAVLAYSAQDGDLRGLAAAHCQRPSNDIWLLGANTTVGQTAVLTISNASQTSATVDLELYGAEGPIEASGSRGILVAPGESEELVLAGLASDQPSLAVRLRSSGGPVTAFIQQSVLRGLTPGGVEYLSPSTGGRSQVMSGVQIQARDVAEAIRAQDGYESAGPAVQVAVPGTSDAVLEVQVYGADGQEALEGGGVLSVPAGTVQEISLADLPEGTYTVEVTSDVPVASTARLSRGVEPDQAVDFAFSPGSGPLGSEHVVPVPSGVTADLAFGAPQGDAAVSVRRVFDDGDVSAATTLTVAAGTTARFNADDVGGGADGTTVGYQMSASGSPVYGAQILTSAQESPDISVVAIPEAAVGQQRLPIVLGF